MHCRKLHKPANVVVMMPESQASIARSVRITNSGFSVSAVGLLDQVMKKAVNSSRIGRVPNPFLGVPRGRKR
jgi:hypothetical protein